MYPVYTPGWREAIVVKCLAQGHKLVSRPGFEPTLRWTEPKNKNPTRDASTTATTTAANQQKENKKHYTLIILFKPTIPSGSWDPSIRIEPPKSAPSQEKRRQSEHFMHPIPIGIHLEDDAKFELVRTGRYVLWVRSISFPGSTPVCPWYVRIALTSLHGLTRVSPKCPDCGVGH